MISNGARVVLGLALSGTIGALSAAVAVVGSLVIAWTTPVRVDIPGIVATWAQDAASEVVLHVHLNETGIAVYVGAVVLVGLAALMLDLRGRRAVSGQGRHLAAE